MNDDHEESVPVVRFAGRRHALLYLCLFATFIISFGLVAIAGVVVDQGCPDTASRDFCAADLAFVAPLLVALASGVCLRLLAHRTVRSLEAARVPIKGWKGMAPWMVIEFFFMFGLFIPVALRQLREPRA